MRYTPDVRLLTLASLILTLTLLHAGCSSGGRPRMADRTADQPVENAAEPTRLAEPATPPPPQEPAATEADHGDDRPPGAEPAPDAEPDEEDGAAPPRPPASTWPAYVSLLGKLDADRPASVTATAETQRSLSLATRNVGRFRIRRDGTSLRYGINVILRIDGQPLEWTARYEALVLERSRNGVWEVVKRVDRRP
jgi:hypothetical protein